MRRARAGALLVAVPFHIFNGLLFTVLLLAQTGLAAWAGAPWRLVLASFAWALFVPVFGLTQSALLPGDLHWIVRAAHLLVGIVAMALAERLAAAAEARLGPPPAAGRDAIGVADHVRGSRYSGGGGAGRLATPGEQ